MHSPYLDPRVDLAFKRVFGEHPLLLMSFLNALLPLPADAPIESLEYLASEQAPEVPGLQKSSIVDVKCKDSNGRIFIVEMQMLWSASFFQRMLFSGSQAYVKQLGKGQDYRGLKPVYALALTSEIFDPATADYLHHYQFVNVRDTNQRIEGLEFVFIELPKFKPVRESQRNLPRTQRRVEKWLRFLSEVGVKDEAFLADWRGDAEIDSALELVEAGKYTEAQLEAYHRSLDRARLETTLLGDAEAKGMAQGMAEGEAKGEAAATARLVQALRAGGMSAEQISGITKVALANVQHALRK